MKSSDALREGKSGYMGEYRSPAHPNASFHHPSQHISYIIAQESVLASDKSAESDNNHATLGPLFCLE